MPASDTSASAANSTYAIEATITNPGDFLRMGMGVKLTVIEQEARNALTIPSNAVQQDENGNNYVELLEDPAAEAKRVQVSYGLQTDYYVQIKGEGITAGTQIYLPEDTSEEQGVSEADGQSEGGGNGVW